MSDKERKSEYLLREIGGIDESFLAEAESYRKKRDPVWLKPLVAVACACVFVVGALGFMVGNGLKANEVGMESAPDNNASLKGDRDDGLKTEATDESAERYSFELDLLISSQGGYKGYDTLASIPREQGRTYVLWQHIDGGKLFISRALENSEVKDINKYLGVGKPVGQDAAEGRRDGGEMGGEAIDESRKG